jgi:hypothetical protein
MQGVWWTRPGLLRTLVSNVIPRSFVQWAAVQLRPYASLNRV